MGDLSDAIEPTCECINGTGLPAVLAREASSFFLLENHWQLLQEAIRELIAVAQSVGIKVTEEINKSNKCDPTVENWQDEVERILAADLEEDYNRLEGCGCFCNCPANLARRYHLGKQIVEKLEQVNRLINKERQFTRYGYTPAPEKVEERPYTKTIGMEPTLELLHEYFNDETRSIIGILGDGGIGKTTLLDAFNNDLMKQCRSFHVVIFIDVSNLKKLDVVAIQRTITERLGLPWVDTDERSRAKILSRVLSQKQFVIILDDVRKEFQMDVVGIPTPNRKNKSKIVLATRDETVCSQMGAQQNIIHMKVLDEDTSLELLKWNLGTEALNAVGTEPIIESCAREIVRACGGLPLALNVIGKSVAGLRNLRDWKDARKAMGTDIGNFYGVEQMFQKLKYSYNKLDKQVKECFLYCTLFPAYSSIRKKQLVKYWMAEGLIPADEPWRGYRIIKKLLSACLLQSTNSDLKVRLHNVIREFGLWLASKDNIFLVRSGQGLENAPSSDQWEGPKRISLMSNDIRSIYISPNCANLETLLLQNNPNLNSLGRNFFNSMSKLRVLDLSNTGIKELPDCDQLVLLQHLNLSQTPLTKLPEKFSVLRELKHLDLSVTEHLEETFDNCSKLLNLRVLNLFRSHYGIRDVSNLNLNSLERLRFLGIAIHAEEVLKELKETDPLAKSTRRLSLKHCEGMESISVAGFNKMEHLEELYIESCDALNKLVVDKDERGTSHLQVLTLWELHSLETIMVQPSPHHFENLRELTIHGCHILKNISWVASLEYLDKLVLSNCDGIRQIVVEMRNETDTMVIFYKIPLGIRADLFLNPDPCSLFAPTPPRSRNHPPRRRRPRLRRRPPRPPPSGLRPAPDLSPASISLTLAAD
ncbi:Disease resistance protein RPS2 [Rhynchospora pubera]|uniref:Disease resistance protein RPS2 n=1 Tax=Rhynchospora pubera TaxID=906938 RepID=A0AAV8BV51_9POAL|nr:Disease resistance protein RPS2 [Rhynchospora pubera]